MPLPSLFFIGKTGVPLDIVTGVTTTVDELLNKINGVLAKVNPNTSTSQENATPTPTPITTAIATEATSAHTQAKDEEVVCENGVCFKRPKENKTQEAAEKGEDSSTETPTTSDANLPSEEKLRRARDLIVKKRKDKEDEDKQVFYTYTMKPIRTKSIKEANNRNVFCLIGCERARIAAPTGRSRITKL